MRRHWCWVVMLGSVALHAHAEDRPELKTPEQMRNYSIGVEIARNFRREAIDLDPELLALGVRDGLGNGPLLLPESEVRRVLGSFRSELLRKVARERHRAALENQRRGNDFLAANRSHAGVVSLPSGVQYKVLKPGNGRMPTETDRIVCHYRGTHLDGTGFDGTEQGRPVTLEVARLIPGWKEAVRRMPAGSRWQIVVPSRLAYGERGLGSDIGPNETLVFEVDLLAVKSGP